MSGRCLLSDHVEMGRPVHGIVDSSDGLAGEYEMSADLLITATCPDGGTYTADDFDGGRYIFCVCRFE